MRKIIPFIITAAFFFTITARPADAKILTNQTGMVTVADNEVVDDDLFVGAQTANIGGTVNGDVFVGAQTAKITGTINGNLHVGANTVFLDGTVKGNVYAGAQNILVTGSQIGGSLLAGGATVDIDSKSAIGGSLLAGAGSVTIDAPVARNVLVGTGMLNIGANTKIGKDLYYATGDKPNEVVIARGAEVKGTIHKTAVKTPRQEVRVTRREAVAAFASFSAVAAIISFIASLIVGYLYMTFFGSEFAKVKDQLLGSFWKCLGIGFLLTIALIPGLIFLCITVIGIPIAGLALLLFLTYLFLTRIVVSNAFGIWIADKFSIKVSAYWTYVLGLSIVTVLGLIPFVNGFVGLLVMWTGLGAFTIRFFTRK